MRFIRSAATTLTLAGKMAFAGIATLAAFTVPALTTPAFAQGVPVNVSPSTVTPGESVTVSVTCPSGSLSATLDGTTLGLDPQIRMTGSMPGANQFATTVKLPASISPGQYSASVDCNPGGASGPANFTVTPSAPAVAHVSPQVAAPGNNVNVVVVCGAGATSATFYGTTLGLSQIPMAPATSPGQFSATVGLPPNIGPGTYAPSITCNNQNNQVTNNVTTSITVNPAPGPPLPIGPPLTGDGATSSVTGGPFALAGVALLGTGGLAVGAGVIRKRRRSGTRTGGGRPTR
jgi:hypothetical protein